jgi:hypothetical protein
MVEIDVVMSPDGSVRINVQGGTDSFEEAKRKIEELEQMLTGAGIPFTIEGPVEQHRETHDPLHAHTHTHA